MEVILSRLMFALFTTLNILIGTQTGFYNYDIYYHLEPDEVKEGEGLLYDLHVDSKLSSHGRIFLNPIIFHHLIDDSRELIIRIKPKSIIINKQIADLAIHLNPMIRDKQVFDLEFFGHYYFLENDISSKLKILNHRAHLWTQEVFLAGVVLENESPDFSEDCDFLTRHPIIGSTSTGFAHMSLADWPEGRPLTYPDEGMTICRFRSDQIENNNENVIVLTTMTYYHLENSATKIKNFHNLSEDLTEDRLFPTCLRAWITTASWENEFLMEVNEAPLMRKPTRE